MSQYILEYLTSQELYKIQITDDKYQIEAYVTESEIMEEICSNFYEYF